MLIKDADIYEFGPGDVRLNGQTIEAVDRALAPTPSEPVIYAGGGALIPGLHDHHIHLLATAAAMSSVDCGPPKVSSRDELEAALLNTSPQPARTKRRATSQWIRGVAYHESVAGRLDRHTLDEITRKTPTRVQHRTGMMWILNSAALNALDCDAADLPPGAERDSDGNATGRFFREDAWLRTKLPPSEMPNLAELSQTLGRYGVTGVTDATYTNSRHEVEFFNDAHASGTFVPFVRAMGNENLTGGSAPAGELKIMIDESRLPDLERLSAQIAAAHAVGRCVAIHCVTRTELMFAIAALRSAKPVRGDRLEHASVAPPEFTREIASLGLTVVTQPCFVYQRGDTYLRDVDTKDQPWLYRLRGFLDAEIPLGAGTDAPYGSADPWISIRSAVRRQTSAGQAFTPQEALTPEEALELFLSSEEAPGGPSRRVAPGHIANLCLLDRPWSLAREQLTSECVQSTFTRGKLVWQRDRGSSGP